MEQSVSKYVIGSVLGRHGRDTVGLEREQHSVRNVGITIIAWLTHVPR